MVPKGRQTGVARNRLKRRIRELLRTRVLPGLPACDLVVRAFPHSYGASFEQLSDELDRVRARILEGSGLRAEGSGSE